MNPVPESIKRDGEDGLLIHWSDGETRYYRAYDLLKACPCAACAKKQPEPGALPIMSAEDNTPVRLEALQPVGHYAYHLNFNVGCSHGIYTLDYLKTLGTVKNEK